jgi:hypothetical protein
MRDSKSKLPQSGARVCTTALSAICSLVSAPRNWAFALDQRTPGGPRSLKHGTRLHLISCVVSTPHLVNNFSFRFPRSSKFPCRFSVQTADIDVDVSPYGGLENASISEARRAETTISLPVEPLVHLAFVFSFPLWSILRTEPGDIGNKVL